MVELLLFIIVCVFIIWFFVLYSDSANHTVTSRNKFQQDAYDRAAFLRKNMTKAEKLFAKQIKSLKIDLFPQYVVFYNRGYFILDLGMIYLLSQHMKKY